MPLRLDAHQHYWRIAAREGEWPPPSLAPIHRDFGPADLAPHLHERQMDGTVLVQSLPTLDDTRELLALAHITLSVKAVVGWVDMKAPDAPAQIATFAAEPKFRGLRPMLQALDNHWIDDDALAPAVAAMLAHDLRFDALVTPAQLDALHAFASRHRTLPIVIDHAAKPPIASGERAPWHDAMARLAQLPNVFCKLSGLWTEADAHTSAQQIGAFIDAAATLFGPERLMWGSDWPVLRLASAHGGYADWFDTCRRHCTRLFGEDDAALDAIFGGTAQRFYRIG
ncbi:amidohydrolase family protein [Burkholderia sp. 22PA0106]|uniref:amidohydrolase family protein n=1 Tax=Burkholderia sp. 22PA0106 TaxID=3237371 RepID=UPI0039C3CA4E